VEGLGETSRTVARGYIAAGACVLWLLIGAVGDKGLCGESNTRAGAFGAPTEKGREAAEPASLQDMSLQVPQVAETTGELKQAFEQKQPWDRGEALNRALTSSLREELDVVRSAAEVARIKQTQALDRERDRADTLARELDRMRIVGLEAVQAIEAEIKQRQALEQERGRADTLARELTSLRAELDAARIAPPEAAQATDAKIKQRQALEQTLKQERDRADTLARELTLLRAEFDAARGASVEAAQAAEAAKVGQKLALDRERDKAETLARELASARKGVEERSALLAAAYAEVLRVTETNSVIAGQQELALAGERGRADALARELASIRNELEAGNRQIASFNAPRAPESRDLAANSSQEPKTESAPGTTEGRGRPPERISGEAVVSNSERSSASELPRPEAQATAREAAPGLDPKVAAGTEQSTSASAGSHFLPDEQRLLARANALLRRADISGARPLLEHALERGSARAAFMLAETYDTRVLQSWGARGISGDLPKARELYARAQAGGIEDAKGRIEALK
jgi:hypothetical protein